MKKPKTALELIANNQFRIEGQIGILTSVANALGFLFNNKEELLKHFPDARDHVFCCETDENNVERFLNSIVDIIEISRKHAREDHFD